MNTFMTVMLIIYMIGCPVAIFFRVVKDEGVSLHALASGWPLASACSVVVLGSLLGAECLLLLQVLLGYQSEFMGLPLDARYFVSPTLLHLVALIVFVRLTLEGIDAATRRIKRESASSDSAATTGAGAAP